MTELKRNLWCSICELQSCDKYACMWCSECEQASCSECEVQHKLSKNSQDHSPISTDDYHRLPSYVANVKSHCSEHDERLDLYCPDHKESCCATCLVTTHRCCASIASVKHILKNTSKEDLLLEYEKSIDYIGKPIHQIKDEHDKSLLTFKERMDTREKDIEAFRKQVNDYLDQMQANVLNKLHNSYKMYEEQTKQLMIENENKIKILTDDIANIKECASVYQTFLATSDIENISDTVISVQSILENCLLEEIDSKSLHVSEWKDKIADLKLIDRIKIRKHKTSQKISKSKTKQTQISAITPITIDNIYLNVDKEILFMQNKSECVVVGCWCLPSGELVFCDHSDNKRIIVFHTDCSFQRLINLNYKPCCLAFINEENFAVTFPDEQKVQIVDFPSGCVRNDIILDDRCVGIAFDNDMLHVRCSSRIYKLCVSGTVAQSVDVESGRPPHIACMGSNIITSTQNTISWLDLNGKQIKRYQIPEVKVIAGLTIDIFGNIYVSGHQSNNVAVFSQNGTRHKIILTAADGIYKPTGLFYDRVRNKLLVTACNTAAVVYDFNK